jgi:diacylglycerol kinase family enzyme
VVVANGQYLDGSDVVPRGHPGDGRLEVQVYALAPGERRAMRRRLASGTHLPHPRIATGSGRRIDVVVEPPTGAEVDGVPVPPRSRWGVEVVPEALRLLV